MVPNRVDTAYHKPPPIPFREHVDELIFAIRFAVPCAGLAG